MSKYIKVGRITKNKSPDGKEFHKMVLDKTFLDQAPELTKKAYELKDGSRSFYMFKADADKAPDWLLFDICVKNEE